MLWHSHGKKKADIFERVKQDVLQTLIKFVLTIYDLVVLFLKEFAKQAQYPLSLSYSSTFGLCSLFYVAFTNLFLVILYLYDDRIVLFNT